MNNNYVYLYNFLSTLKYFIKTASYDSFHRKLSKGHI